MTSTIDATSVVSLEDFTSDDMGIVATGEPREAHGAGTMAATTAQVDSTAAVFANATTVIETTTPVDATATATTLASTTTAQTSNVVTETTTPVDTTTIAETTFATSTVKDTTVATSTVPDTTVAESTTVHPVATVTSQANTVSTGGITTLPPSNATTDFQALNITAVPSTASQGSVVSTTNVNTVTQPNKIIGLDPWLFGVLAGAVVLVLIILIVVMICLMRKRRRSFRVKAAQNPHWISDAGAVQLSIIPKDEIWNSESIEDKTTMYVGNQTTINVFDTDNQAFASSPTITRLTQKQREETDTDDISSVASTEQSQASPKPGKTLTKVSVPVIGKPPSVSETSDAPKAVSDTDDAVSVFSSKSDTTPKRSVGQSLESFKTTSPAHQTEANSAPPAPPSVEKNADGVLPPPPPAPPSGASPKIERDVTGAPVANTGEKERQTSFLHNAPTSPKTGIPPPPSSTGIPPPPSSTGIPPPPSSTGIPPPPPL